MIFFSVRKNSSSCDCEIQKFTSQRQKVSRLSTKTSGRPYSLFCQPSDVRRPKQHLFLYSVCVGVVIPFILDVKLVYAPAGITQEEGQTGLLHLHFAVLALIFIARRILALHWNVAILPVVRKAPHLSPVFALRFFFRDANSAFLQLVN